MNNKNEILYSDYNNEQFIYYINENKKELYYSKDIFNEISNNKYYSYEVYKVSTGFFSSKINFRITKKATGDTKTIDEKDMDSLLKNEIARYLDKNMEFNLVI